MGWASGSELAERIWDIVKNHISEEAKQNVALRICEAFEDKDCDTIQEAEELFACAYMSGYRRGTDPEGQYSLDDDEAVSLIRGVVADGIELDSVKLNSVLNWLGELPDRL